MISVFLDGLLILSLVLDAFAAAFACGAKGIRIPFLPALAIGAAGTFFLALSTSASLLFRPLLPEEAAKWVSFGILFSIGVFSVFQSALKERLRRAERGERNLRFKLAGISFAVRVYLDETRADLDASKKLSVREALFLGAVLSLDSCGIGFGNGFSSRGSGFLLLFSIIAHPAAVLIGQALGKRLSGRLPGAFSAAGGGILILLALFKLL